MENLLEELKKETIELAKKVGRLEERNRIMTEMLKVDFPIGIWTHVKKIINPD